MINWLANVSNRIAILFAMSFALVACGGGGGGSGGGFLTPEETVPVIIITTSLPDATAGEDYTAIIDAEGGTAPYEWALTDDGETGLTINNDGIITGMAPAAGEYGLTVEVYDSDNQSDKLSVILTVAVGAGPVTISTTALMNAIEGLEYTMLIQASGGSEPYRWTVTDDGGTGLTINNDGFLTGTAPQSGDYGLTIEVADTADITDRASFIFTVTGDTPQPLAIATSSIPSVEERKSYTAILEAIGGQGDYLWTMINSGGTGLQLRDDGLLSGTAPAEGQYGLTVSVMDNVRTVSSTLILTVTAEATPLTITSSSLPDGIVDELYATVLKASGGDAPYTWTLLSDGGQTGLTLSTAGVLSGTPSLNGTFGLVFGVNDGNSTAQSAITLTVTEEPDVIEELKITTESLPDAARVLYAAAVEATGGVKPYLWAGNDTNVPPAPVTGFVIDSVSGSITGNTNELLPGQYGYSVTVQDSAGETDVRSYVITVPGGDSPPIRILTENPLDTAYETIFYTQILRAVGGSGDDKAWSVIDTAGFPGNPPAFAPGTDQATGILTWKAADIRQGNYLITIQVVDKIDESSDVVTYDLQASAAPVRITTETTLPGGVVGTAYSTVFSAEGGGGTNTWSVVRVVSANTSATTPNFNSVADAASGTLTWPAPEIGTYVLLVKVVSEDGAGIASDDEKLFTLEVLPTP